MERNEIILIETLKNYVFIASFIVELEETSDYKI